MEKSEYLTVSLLTQYLQRKFDYDPYLQKVYLVGEISNYRMRPNSHQYFTLKDDGAEISAIMYQSSFNKLKFKPEEGMKVFAVGRIGMYPKRGSYQIYVESMEPDGVGALFLAYEQLKKKLAAEGYFDRFKKPIPKFPKQIAVVTSQSGAVIRDIITTAHRRYPQAQIVLFPAVVQGDNAKFSLVDALTQIQRIEDQFDVLIIGRGGGSFEDLYPFNEEMVVKKIAEMNIPVISSVGHETDVTISDLVADVRAATPTAAAEFATPDLQAELINLRKLQNSLFANIKKEIKQNRLGLELVNSHIIMKQPNRLFEQRIQYLDQVKQQFNHVVANYFGQKRQSLVLVQNKLTGISTQQKISDLRMKNHYLSQTMFARIKAVVTAKRHDQVVVIRQLDELSPLKILSRGYVFTTDEDDRVVTKARDLKVHQQLNLHFTDGQVLTKVDKIMEANRDWKES